MRNRYWIWSGIGLTMAVVAAALARAGGGLDR